MDRTPEPELMTEEDQALAYAEADFEKPHNHFVELLRDAHPALAPEGAALDLGCGPGDISIRVARALLGWSVDGVDGSDAMLRLGSKAVETAGLSDRVQLVKAFLPEDEAPRSTYDLIFSNSLLHHLHNPRVIWDAVAKYSEVGTPVFVMDLMRPPDAETAQTMVDEYAAGEPEILRRDFLWSLHAAFTLDEVKAQLAESGLEHLIVHAVSDRHLVVRGNR